MTDTQPHVERVPIQPATVKLTIPCAAEYVSVARLAILGIASRMPFSYDEVEDVRLAVGEACTHAVERAKLLIDSSVPVSNALNGRAPHNITITSSVSEESLTIEVSDNVETAMVAPPAGNDEFEDDDIDHQGLGALLIEILVDEVEIQTTNDGTTVKLLKHAPVHH